MKAFINSQFGYCPLVWMCHSRRLNHRINRIQERSLRIVYDDAISSYEDLLRLDDSVTIHEKNIQALVTEMFKVVKGIGPDIMNDVFQLKENSLYSTRFPFKTHNVHTEHYGKESLSFLGPKLWSLVPEKIKMSNSLKEFKELIKTWKTDKCPCRLCKTYIHGVGYVVVS